MTRGGPDLAKQRLFALVAGLVICLAAIWYFLRRAETQDAAPPAAEAEEVEIPLVEETPPPRGPAAETPTAPPKEKEASADAARPAR